MNILVVTMCMYSTTELLYVGTYLSTTFIYVDSWKTRISRENFKVGPYSMTYTILLCIGWEKYMYTL